MDAEQLSVGKARTDRHLSHGESRVFQTPTFDPVEPVPDFDFDQSLPDDFDR